MIIGLFLAFGEALGQFAWVRWVGVAIIVALRLTHPNAETEGRGNLNEIADEHPWLKWWGVLTGVVFFVSAIVIARSPYRIAEEDEILFLVGALALVIGPAVALNERRKFREAGD